MSPLNISCGCFSFGACRDVRLHSLLVFYTISAKSALAPPHLLSGNLVPRPGAVLAHMSTNS